MIDLEILTEVASNIFSEFWLLVVLIIGVILGFEMGHRIINLFKG